MIATIEATETKTFTRSITLKVEHVVCVVAVQTAEFELPDAEFDF